MPVSGPNWNPKKAYYDCRYAVLREPLGFPRGAEILADDDQAIHAWVESEGKVVAVGRAHLIPADSDGSQACLLYTSPSPRDMRRSRMPSSA